MRSTVAGRRRQIYIGADVLVQAPPWTLALGARRVGFRGIATDIFRYQRACVIAFGAVNRAYSRSGELWGDGIRSLFVAESTVGVDTRGATRGEITSEQSPPRSRWRLRQQW